jgi:hypothetical protein
MTDQDISTQESPPRIMAAVSYVLRPLVRLMLSHGISFQMFSDLVRSTYVKVAEAEFRLDSKSQTDSRISLLTGIHRREVNRLRNEPPSEISLSQHASMSALLFTIWSGHPEYLDEQGTPIPLARLASQDGKRSFESLVQSISKDFRARVVLDEWLRQGIVTLDENDMVHLRDDAFTTPQDLQEKIYYFGQNIHDHLAATVHNLAGDAPPFLERCVFYDKLSPESVQELSDYSRTVGMRALQSINKRAAELQKRDQGRPDAAYRTNFGVYNFSETENSHETSTN